MNDSPVEYLTLEPVALPAARTPADPGVRTPSPGPDAISQVVTRPVYPFELGLASVTGTALVDFYVKTDGRVANAIPIRATDIRLANAAITAVSAWTFVPGRRSGQLVTTHMQVPIIFSLN